GKDTQHELGQPLKKLAYVSNHRSPLLRIKKPSNRFPLLGFSIFRKNYLEVIIDTKVNFIIKRR
ncbi:TPA: hypothetical protein ACGF3N_003731, partial [Vibrio cholerae]